MIRHPSRLDKPVTQEELAEALGISREWYARIECGTATRVPPALLGRMADTLMLDETQRNALFEFAIPELRRAPIGEVAASALQLSSLQPVLRRLWAASSEADIITSVLEFAQELFPRTDVILCTNHVAQGYWTHAVTLGPDPVQQRIANLAELIASECTVSEIDQWFLHGVLVQPGETVLFHQVWSELGIIDMIPNFLQRVGLGHSSVLISHVRSRKNFVGNLAIGRAGAPYEFPVTNATIFGALADLASLALST
jgi:transcriptional regulator with XRE-family HTH domain